MSITAGRERMLTALVAYVWAVLQPASGYLLNPVTSNIIYSPRTFFETKKLYNEAVTMQCRVYEYAADDSR